ncbi:MAG: hypothetical protein FWF08_02225 [Oscillospiraceae bacterium]|nr:hypothetical protein [Oscillospiraceae bacterium]
MSFSKKALIACVVLFICLAYTAYSLPPPPGQMYMTAFEEIRTNPPPQASPGAVIEKQTDGETARPSQTAYGAENIIQNYGNTVPKESLSTHQTSAEPAAALSNIADIETVGADQKENPSFADAAQCLEALTEAVNRTRAFKGGLSVSRAETFESNVAECTGGPLASGVINSLVGKVVKPKNETLSFNGGLAVDGEGKTIPLLLPQNGPFSLKANGVSSIRAEENGGGLTVYLQLIPETCGLNEIPEHNASAMGFLNTGNLDISFLTVTSAKIVYTGSAITANINGVGMITSVTYTMPMHIEGVAKAMGIKGSAVIDGCKTEKWEISAISE